MNNPLSLFEELDKTKIDYVVWKNCNLINKFFDGNENLDIYVKHENKENFETILKEKLWVEVKSTTTNHKYINHYLFISDKKIFHIHVYFRLITGNSISKNYDLTKSYNLFENKIFDTKNKLWLMSYELQLELFKIRLASKHQSLLGTFLINRDLDNYINEYRLLIEKSITKNKFRFSRFQINEKKMRFLNKNDSLSILNQILRYKRISNHYTLFIEIKFIFKILIKKILNTKRFRLKKNLFIFISGADSSGKTTLINDFEKLFSKYAKTKKYNIGKPFPQFISHFFFYKKKSSKKIITHDDANDSISKIFKNLNLALLRYIYSLNIFYFNGRTNIFLFDRYVSEFQGQINGPRLKVHKKLNLFKRLIYKLENHFYKFIKPLDIEFRLMTSLEICLKRNFERSKKEKETDNDIIQRYNIFLKTKFKSKRVIELENDSNKTEAINKIIKIIVIDLNENN